MPAPAIAEPQAWLVFRLGPHLMCAPAVDVEGIIEPARPRPVPFSPPYMLGWFDFRGRVAAVISLRTKFGVRSGQDSESGPYIVARVNGDLAAFWVDEVRDVLEAHQVSWQPMPEMPGAAAFDCYTIQDGEVVLRTTFEALLRADSVAAFEAAPAPARPIAEDPEPGPAEAPRSEPRADAAAPPTAEAVQFRSPESSPPSPAVPPDLIADEPSPTPAEPEAAPEASPPPAPAAPTEPIAPPDPPPARPRYSDPLRPASGRRDESRHAPRATPRPRPAEAPPRREPEVASRPSMPRRETRFDPVPEFARESTAPQRRGLAVAGAVLAVLLVGGVVLWWWMSPAGGPAETPLASGRISESPAAPIAPRAAPPVESPAPSPAEPPADAAQPAAPSEPAAPATTRVLTVEARDFKLTVDRPVKPQPRTGAGAPPAPASPPSAAPPGSAAAGNAKRVTYTVVRGDTLGHIAHRFLGDAARYPELARVSRIRDPDLIYPGDIVTIDKIGTRP